MKLPTVAESNEATSLGEQLGREGLLERAALVVRCDDCGGRVIAAVAYVQGRPLAATPGQGDRLARERTVPRHWEFAWADRGSFCTLVGVRAGMS